MAPKWRELADRLAERIKSGEYEPGQQLPHIRDLVEAGEGSKSTVHQAYKALEAEGLVTSSRGHGTVVRRQTPLKRLGIARYDKANWRCSEEAALTSGRGRSDEQTQTVNRVAAPPIVAAAFGLPDGAEVYMRGWLVREGEQPTHTLTSYYHPEHVEGTRLVDAASGPEGRDDCFQVLCDMGYEIDHMKEELFARVSTSDEAKLLHLSLREPVVELRRTTRTADGTVVEFAIDVHVAARFTWEYEFKVPNSA
ncbi:GntR family transcriptional regulator [Streptomyces sp. NPDC059850]|uniref:GntR family transcriptional regulator n=1 Tax=Streptomyces sp. NPDC059850 TaxID=3346970 RepID=UPI00364D3111